MLLAIDTSAGTSVAVVDRDRGVIAERHSDDTRLHAEVIGTLLRECLSASEVAVADLSAVAAGMGPGPFTGLRVGIAAAQAFAFGADVPLVRVISHDAIAAEYYQRTANTERTERTEHHEHPEHPEHPEHHDHDGPLPLLVVTDARRREVYWSTYSGLDADGLPIRVGEPGLAKPEALADAVPAIEGYRRVDAATVSAAALGMVAELMFSVGRTFADIQPLYLRSPDVTMSNGPKRVTG